METTLIEKLALSVIQRIDVLGIKGKARDGEMKEHDHGAE